MPIRIQTTAAILFASLLLGGCVPGMHVRAESGDPGIEVKEITPEVILAEAEQGGAKVSEDLPDASQLAAPTEYLVGPGDVLQIVVWDHLELTNPFGAVTRDPVSSGQLVASDGTLYFPYAGTFKVEGLTIRQIREFLTGKLSPVITRPQIDVRVTAFRSRRIQVTGEVKNPGIVTLDDTTKGVLEAINERGGLNPTASRRHVSLIRDGKSYQVDLANLLSGNNPAINPLLVSGDIVHIPDLGDDQVFVLGEIARPGTVLMGQQSMTLTEALTKSGGLDKLTSDDSGVLVFRRSSEPSKGAKVFTLDMSTPKGVLLAGEFDLRPRDVVYVKATSFAQYNLVIGQLLPTVTAVYQLDRLTGRR